MNILRQVSAILLLCTFAASPRPAAAGAGAEVRHVTVSFDANGGSGRMSPKRLRASRTMKLPTCAFTRPGYVFAGWCCTCGGRVCEEAVDEWLPAKRLISASADVTYRAMWREKWTPPAMTYSAVVLDCNGDAAGLVFLKLGRQNARTGAVKVNASILRPKQKTLKLSGVVDSGEFDLSWRMEQLHVVLAENGLSGDFNGDPVRGMPLQATIPTGPYTFHSEGLWFVDEHNWTCHPTDVPFQAGGSFWATPRKTAAEILPGSVGLQLDEGANPWDLQLAYSRVNGKITGGYRLFRCDDLGHLSSEKCTVTGVMVGDEGLGYSVAKKRGTIHWFTISR